jgi:hypothetical protein
LHGVGWEEISTYLAYATEKEKVTSLLHKEVPHTSKNYIH